MASAAGTAPLADVDDLVRHRSPAGRTGYLLLLPAALWLGIFFVIPFYSLVGDQPVRPQSARTPRATR